MLSGQYDGKRSVGADSKDAWPLLVLRFSAAQSVVWEIDYRVGRVDKIRPQVANLPLNKLNEEKKWIDMGNLCDAEEACCRRNADRQRDFFEISMTGLKPGIGRGSGSLR